MTTCCALCCAKKQDIVSFKELFKIRTDALSIEELLSICSTAQIQSQSCQHTNSRNLGYNEDFATFSKLDYAMHPKNSKMQEDLKERRVTIADCSEIIYNFRKGTNAGNQRHYNFRYPLKSALKNSSTLNSFNYELMRNGRSSHLSCSDDITGFIQFSNFNSGLESDIYDPSLPYMPLNDIDLKNTVVSNDELLNNANIEWNLQSLKMATNIHQGLAEWHEAIQSTSKIGWVLILYLAVRSHYNPKAFSKFLLEVLHKF